jgi:hypothetical protein
MDKVGGKGVITVEESKTTETALEVVEGQAVDVIDHDDIDPARLHLGEKCLQGGRSSEAPDRPPSS